MTKPGWLTPNEAMLILKGLPPDHAKVLSALTDEWQYPTGLTAALGGNTDRRREMVRRICRDLVRRGLAEQGGTKLMPSWRRRG